MRRAHHSFENIFFLCATLALLCASAAALRHHHAFANPRIQYGMARLPAALFVSALFTAILALLRARLFASNRLQNRSTTFYLLAISAVFACFWLPTLVAGGFANDDWRLLAGASIRKVIWLHPQYSWHALDTVDGNFRPLGTVLYVGFFYHLFGLHPLPYLAGNFLLGLLTGIIAFFLVRELGYSRIAAAAASLLYISRGLTYTPNAWVAAFGDALVIPLCGLIVLCALRACKQTPARAFLYHALAWTLFVIATLAKQSAFTIPLIMALLLLIRPGDAPPLSRPLRIRAAALALFVYGGTAAVIFFHAKTLFGTRTPYPISLTFQSLSGIFNYAIWYFMTCDLPDANRLAFALPCLAGFAVVIAFAILIWKFPRALGDRPRDIVFLVLAALAALSLFLLLPTRGAAYYGAMAALWISIAFGIALTRFTQATSGALAPRIACFAFCALIAVGFLDVRIKQTGLIPSGGYIWGTYGSDLQTAEYNRLAGLLAASPRDTLVLVDVPPESLYPAMALLSDPRLNRILIYESKSGSFLVNDRHGSRPQDTYNALNDLQAYHWSLPGTDADSSGPLHQALWIGLHDGALTPVAPLR